MGLIDILNGMQNGPRGQKQPAPPGKAGGGGMSPLMMALLALLAYKGMKGFGQSQTAPAGGQQPSLPPGGGSTAKRAGRRDRRHSRQHPGRQARHAGSRRWRRRTG